MSTFAISLHFSKVQVAHCTMDFTLWLLVPYGLLLPWLNSSHKHIHENTNDLKQLPVCHFQCKHSFWYVLVSGSDIIFQGNQDEKDLASTWVLSSLLTSECSSDDASLTASLYTNPYSIFSYLWAVLDYLQGPFGSASPLWEKKILVYLDLFSWRDHYIQHLCQALHKGSWPVSNLSLLQYQYYYQENQYWCSHEFPKSLLVRGFSKMVWVFPGAGKLLCYWRLLPALIHLPSSD